MRRSGLKCAAFAVSFFVVGSAAAQDQIWLRDRRYTEGIGYRVGDLELHPGVAGEVGYDSNYFLRAPSEPPIIDEFRIRVTPSLSLSTLSPQRTEGSEPPKVNFRAGLSATYNEFFATQSQYSDQVSKQRNVGGVGSLQLTILPRRPLGGDVYADFLRLLQGSNNPDQNTNQIQFRAGAGVTWTPGGGLFDWRFGYEYQLTSFQEEAFKYLNNQYHQVNTRGRWKFLPRTALIYDASLSFLRYNDEAASSNAGLFESDPIRARIGVNGLVTPMFAVLGMVGWGASFYKGPRDAPNFNSVIGQAEVKWFLTPNPSSDPSGATLTLSSLALGYTRDFQNSYVANYYTRDRGYLNVSYFFGGRVLTVLEGGVAAIEYPTFTRFVGGPTTQAFTDVLYDVNLFAEYRLSDSFGLNTTLHYGDYESKTRIPTSATGGTDDLTWRRFEGYVGVRWFM